MASPYPRKKPDPSGALPRGELLAHGPTAMAKVVMNHKAMVNMAREHTTDAILYLVRALHMPSASVMARLKAAELLLAYGWGKPPQAIAITTDNTIPNQGIGALSIQDRVKAITEATLGPVRRPVDLKTSDVTVVATPAAPAVGEEFV